MKILPLVGAVVAVSGCASVKEFVPIRPAAMQTRMPNQQRLIANSTNDAIKEAVADPRLNLSQYKGLKTRVDVNGVFPPPGADLLDYVSTAVEGELIAAGLAVMPHYSQGAVRVEAQGQTVALHADPPEKPDLRVVASLDWGGIDYEESQSIIGSRVAACVLLSIFTGGIGGIIYALAVDFHEHTFTLKSRVHLTVRALPYLPERRPGFGMGSGEAKIVIDARSDSGYTNSLTVPVKAGEL